MIKSRFIEKKNYPIDYHFESLKTKRIYKTCPEKNPLRVFRKFWMKF